MEQYGSSIISIPSRYDYKSGMTVNGASVFIFQFLHGTIISSNRTPSKFESSEFQFLHGTIISGWAQMG